MSDVARRVAAKAREVIDRRAAEAEVLATPLVQKLRGIISGRKGGIAARRPTRSLVADGVAARRVLVDELAQQPQ